MDRSVVCVEDVENYARQHLPKTIFDFYYTGAGNHETLNNNRAAFSKFRIRPQYLRNVSERKLYLNVLGTNIAFPIGIAPLALQKMAHPDGECATAKAAEKMGTIFIMSTMSTTTIEEVAQAAPLGVKWFQLYIYKDREITKSFVKRAEAAGFKAIVLTVDAPISGLKYADIRNNFSIPAHLKLANLPYLDDYSNYKNTADDLFDSTIQWKDVKWLQSITTLPIILKGILTAEDAIKAIELGVLGIIVSNHGGRQIDCVPATIEVLPEIVKAVGHKMEIYVDSGFRNGTDIFKALALGAKMVFIGRPIVWGLTYDGESGVIKVLDIQRTELETAFALTGCTSIEDVTSAKVVHESVYSRM